MTYFLNPSHLSVCQYGYSPIVVRQRLGKIITMATNTHAYLQFLVDIYKLLDVLVARTTTLTWN
jgi:hypothetical protein